MKNKLRLYTATFKDCDEAICRYILARSFDEAYVVALCLPTARLMELESLVEEETYGIEIVNWDKVCFSS